MRRDVSPVSARDQHNLQKIVIVRNGVSLRHRIAHIEQRSVCAEDLPPQ
jgi:hypothetical protein